MRGCVIVFSLVILICIFVLSSGGKLKYSCVFNVLGGECGIFAFLYAQSH